MKIRPRIIPVLLYKKGGLVKTTAFKKPQYIGDPINAVKIFNDKEVDELIFLDIDATKENRPPGFDYIKEVAGECFMPLAYGGGITTLNDIEKLVKGGVEKVCINSKATDDPAFIAEAAEKFATSTIVVSIDIGKDFLGNYHIFSHGGTKKSNFKPVEFAKMVEQYGAGEILVNSIDRDGTQSGYDLKLISLIALAVNIPVIACGGAAVVKDFSLAIEAGASAAAAGSMFVFTGKYKAVLINFPSNNDLQRD
jgi:cyclase